MLLIPAPDRPRADVVFSWEIYEDGALFGVIYRFRERGQGIGMHDHADRGDYHNIVVLSGAIEIYGPNRRWSRTLRGGDIMRLDRELHHPHEIVALKEGSSFLGLFTDGRPEGMKLTSADRSGFTNKPPTLPLPQA